MKNVKLIRLKYSHDEIIADVSESLDGQKVILDEPVIFVPQPSPDGQSIAGFTIVPWNFISKDKRYEISADAVLYMVSPQDSIERKYIEKTSGIILATNDANYRK